MRTTKITAVALVIAMGTIVYATGSLTGAREMVDISEEVLAGDVNHVKDLNLVLKTQMGEDHLWQMEIPLGAVEETQVTYDFHKGAYEAKSVIEPELTLDIPSQMSCTYYDCSIEQMIEMIRKEDAGSPSYSDIIEDVAQRATTYPYSETMKYSDYYDYYVLNSYSQIGDKYGVTHRYLTLEAEAKIRKAIQLPVIEGDEIKLTLGYTEAEGESYVDFDMSQDSYDVIIESHSVVYEDGIYLAVQSGYYLEQSADPHMAAGASIYYIPILSEEKEEEVEVGEIKQVACLSEEAQLLDFIDGGEVFLALMNQEGETYLSVLDKSDFTEIQHVELAQKGNSIEGMDGALYIHGETDGFTVLKLVDGEYVIAIECENDEMNLEGPGGYEYDAQYAYIDQRFIKIQCFKEYDELDDVVLSCYGPEGLLYSGRYHNSQQDELREIEYDHQVTFYESPSVGK